MGIRERERAGSFNKSLKEVGMYSILMGNMPEKKLFRLFCDTLDIAIK